MENKTRSRTVKICECHLGVTCARCQRQVAETGMLMPVAASRPSIVLAGVGGGGRGLRCPRRPRLVRPLKPAITFPGRNSSTERLSRNSVISGGFEFDDGFPARKGPHGSGDAQRRRWCTSDGNNERCVIARSPHPLGQSVTLSFSLWKLPSFHASGFP